MFRERCTAIYPMFYGDQNYSRAPFQLIYETQSRSTVLQLKGLFQILGSNSYLIVLILAKVNILYLRRLNANLTAKMTRLPALKMVVSIFGVRRIVEQQTSALEVVYWRLPITLIWT